jgi:hypothetical protein
MRDTVRVFSKIDGIMERFKYSSVLIVNMSTASKVGLTLLGLTLFLSLAVLFGLTAQVFEANFLPSQSLGGYTLMVSGMKTIFVMTLILLALVFIIAVVEVWIDERV